jgi:hypothetical protein
LGRRIALVDVLREIKSEIPEDAVYLYLLGVDNSGLSEVLFDEFHKGVYDNEGSNAVAGKVKPLVIPTSVRKMVREYVDRTILRDIDYSNDSEAFRIYSFDECTSNTYPKFVRDALDSVEIAQHASLDDHRSAVLSLKAAVCHGGVNHAVASSRGCLYAGCGSVLNDAKWRDLGFDVLSARQRSKLALFDQMYWMALTKMRSKNELLGPYEWSTFCDLMEVLSLLEYKRGFREASNAYAIHEYSKMAAVGQERIEKVRWDYPVAGLRNFITGAIDSSLELYSKFSPAAALLVGRNVRLSWLHDICQTGRTLALRYYDEKAIRALVESKGPNTQSVAVRLFMEQEIAIERRKIQTVASVLKTNRHERNQYDGECDCEAPCECC